MTSYVMEAKENYDPTRAAQADSGTFTNGTFVDAHLIGFSFDAGNRELVYSAVIMPDGGSVATNTTGHDLWDGAAAITAGATYDGATNFNFYLARKNIDTGTVTYCSAYDPAATVPAGVYGDGSARRYVTDTSVDQQYPCLTDPRTHDAWVHQQSCFLYVFRAADNWSMHISPLRPVGDINNPVLPIGMETDWVYATEYSALGLGVANLYLVPRLTTAAETSADVILAYATYTLPYTPVQQYFRTAMDNGGGFWSLSINVSGSTPGLKLHKFTKPSAFVYPTPPVDGGFTDETPWTATTGPNALFSDVTLANKTDRLGVYFSPGRAQLNLLYMRYSTDSGAADAALGYTWYNTVDGTWGSSVLAEGYMTADFAHTTDPNAAAWLIEGPFNQTNLYLDADNFYVDGDYASRWILVDAYPMSGGFPGANDQLLLLKLTWNTGAAPTITVVSEDGWDAAYSAYGAAISNPSVVRASVQAPVLAFFLGQDALVYDATDDAFWGSGMNSQQGHNDHMFKLDSAFAGRQSATGPELTFAQPPLLKLSFGPSVAFSNSVVRSYVGKPQL